MNVLNTLNGYYNTLVNDDIDSGQHKIPLAQLDHVVIDLTLKNQRNNTLSITVSGDLSDIICITSPLYHNSNVITMSF